MATATYKVFAEAQEIAETKPHTGSIPPGGVPDRMQDIPGAELGTPLWEVLEARSPPDGDVIFYDGTGTAAGLNGAHTLATAGASLVFVTPDPLSGSEFRTL